MALCGLNYARLIRLVTNLSQLSPRQQLSWQLPAQQELRLEVLQASRYTLELNLLLSQTGEALTQWQQPLSLRVRVYHDASLAEVVSCNDSGRLQAIYPYPNAKMQQRNEKHELNRFFAEWLSYCAEQGTPVTPVVKDFFQF